MIIFSHWDDGCSVMHPRRRLHRIMHLGTSRGERIWSASAMRSERLP
jgi:hypothetical protein